MACSATAIGSRCRRCWPASPTRSPTKAFSISSRTRSGTPTGLATAARGAARAPRRVDHRRHQFSQTGHPLGRRGASVLWRAGQDRELPSRGDGRALDRRARVDDRRAVVSPETVAQRRRSARGGADSGRRVLPGEMASGADVDPTRARRGPADHGRARRRRVRRRHRFRRALHRWRLPYAVGVSRHLTVFPGTPAVHVPPSATHGPAAIAAGARARHASDRRTRLGAGLARARVATGDLAQRHESPVGGPLRRRPRHPRPRLARSTAGARGLAPVRTGSRRDAAHEILLRRPARHARR